MSRVRILVVEDEAIIAADLQLTLKRFGYDVPETADTGELAIARARALLPDLILMDIRLKGELDGIQAAQTIQRERDVPIIFLTAYTDEDTLKRARGALPFAYVVKPFHEAQLRTAIGVALDKHARDRDRARHADLLGAVLGNLDDAVLVVDADDRRIEYANPAAARLLASAPDALLGAPADEKVPIRVSRRPTLTQAIAEAATGVEADLAPRGTFLEAGGLSRPVACHVAPIELVGARAVLVVLREPRDGPSVARDARRLREDLGRRMAELV